MYENYLLDAAAIAAEVGSEDKAEGNPIGTETVIEWLQAHANSWLFAQFSGIEHWPA